MYAGKKKITPLISICSLRLKSVFGYVVWLSRSLLPTDSNSTVQRKKKNYKQQFYGYRLNGPNISSTQKKKKVQLWSLCTISVIFYKDLWVLVNSQTDIQTQRHTDMQTHRHTFITTSVLFFFGKTPQQHHGRIRREQQLLGSRISSDNCLVKFQHFFFISALQLPIISCVIQYLI